MEQDQIIYVHAQYIVPDEKDELSAWSGRAGSPWSSIAPCMLLEKPSVRVQSTSVAGSSRISYKG